jgi:hypothetical protein
MKNIKKYILILVVLFTGCEDEDPFVEIDSLSAWGNEFYLREKVKVWMAVKTDNLPAARYTWSSDAGKFTQPQTLDENTWQAPREPGTYTVTCTVDVDGVKQTRSRQMNVLPIYYFDKFEKLPLSFYGSSSSVNQIDDPLTKTSHIETRVNANGITRGFIFRPFDDRELQAPFSTQAKVGWISNFPAGPITMGNNPPVTAQNTLYYAWTFNRDPDKEDNEYIEAIQFEWYPRGRSGGLPTTPGGQPYNGVLRILARNILSNTINFMEVYVNDPTLTFVQNQLKNVSMSVDADYRTYVHVDGVEIMNTDFIQTWRTTSNGGTGSKDEIYINQWMFNFVSNTGSNTALIYFDDAMAYHDGTILK